MNSIDKGHRLQDKFALVTGAGSGIGAATARLFAAEGATVAVTDIDETALGNTLEQIRCDGGSAISYRLDIASQADWEAVVAATISELGRLDILVNNAGIHPPIDSRLGTISLEEWNRILEVDLTGPFLGTQSVLPEFLKNGGGAIVNVVSVSALVAGPYSHYNSAKAGVRTLTRSTAFVYAKDNIRANAVFPGFISTNLTAAALANPEHKSRLQANIPMSMIGEPADIAHGILYLASDDARFVTGADLVIDGGRTLK